MPTISDRAWDDILALLRRRWPDLVRPWFRTLQPEQMDRGVLLVRPREMAHFDYLRRHCQEAFREAAQEVLGRLVTVEFAEPDTPAVPETPLSFGGDSAQFTLNGDYTFENFITGPCNRLAHAAAVAVAENPGRVYNPLFIHGDVGLGKTHLLQAVCHELRCRHAAGRVLYITCETFTNHYVEAIERGAVHQFRDCYRSVDALVIDDVQFLASRERSREEFFHTFNSLFQSQIQIILSADESPRGIPSLEDRLVSRFNWGLVARIESPCLETRMAILRRKAKTRCAEVPEDVVHYVAAYTNSSIRELEGALTKVLAVSQQYGGRIDLDIAKEAIGDHLPATTREPSITDIMDVVMERYNVRMSDLQGKKRNRSLVFARQVCMYLARELTSLSLEEIGGHFGGRDHSTVLHGVRAIQEQLANDEELPLIMKDLMQRLRQS